MQISYLDKVKKLRDYYAADQESLQELQSAEELEALEGAFKEIKDNFAIQKTIEQAKKVIAGIDLVLLHQKNLTTEDRNQLLRDKKVHDFYLARLSGERIQERIKSKQAFIEREFKKLFPEEE